MERLWAPWRMEYMMAPQHDSCFLCEAAEAGVDRNHLVLVKREFCLIMLNRYPYVGGHLMVVPLRHTGELDDLDDAEQLDLLHGVRQARAALRRTSAPEGFNIGMNIGKPAGAGLENHLHIHVVPRWNGDTNFMQPVGELRIISEGLKESYDRLRAAIDC
ncbi:HIT family protein [Pelotalea chapellei]|uniref:HIT domain-containing protein n=1 Tax=Pelotalea chapellei TaxID=44671 RepID=A0ABS5UCX9_9BACT|nr:HIT domain-containing protein [Pelotalea chapellei]MBT1073544.1 HIT domain-containing protein [Pelotalea chapellei]